MSNAPQARLRDQIEELIRVHGSYAVLRAARENHGYGHTCWHIEDLDGPWQEAGLPDDDAMKTEFMLNNANRIRGAAIQAGNEAIALLVSFYAAERRAIAAA